MGLVPLKRLVLLGVITVALTVGATLSSCGDNKGASTPATRSPGASGTPKVADERAALPPRWVSDFVKAATKDRGEPELVEWARMAGRPKDGGLTGNTAKSTFDSYFFADFAADDVVRSLGAYVVAAHGDFTVTPRVGDPPVSVRTLVFVVRGVKSRDGDGISANHSSSYVGTVHLAGGDVHVYGPSVGLTPGP